MFNYVMIGLVSARLLSEGAKWVWRRWRGGKEDPSRDDECDGD